MIHALIAAITCAILFFVPHMVWAAMLWSAAFYIGREVAQAEYRYIEAHGGKRANVPWYCFIFPSAWTLKSVLDWLLPFVVGWVAAGLFIYFKG